MDEFLLDFVGIDRLKMKDLGIAPSQVANVLLLGNTCVHEFKNPEHMYAIGYFDGIKFLHIAYRISKKIKFDLEILQVGIPNEEDIKRYWCK
ncbi:MAG: hypothetical protein RIF33_26700 [Cyclobacteriaceae bacterium]